MSEPIHDGNEPDSGEFKPTQDLDPFPSLDLRRQVFDLIVQMVWQSGYRRAEVGIGARYASLLDLSWNGEGTGWSGTTPTTLRDQILNLGPVVDCYVDLSPFPRIGTGREATTSNLSEKNFEENPRIGRPFSPGSYIT